ncbi:MAG: hypothetical protein IV090_08055 [Candidatus Sericytochromatia bacterium]|nr:hypothetical protein [Candidatus Sericytochromatia bacterium]
MADKKKPTTDELYRRSQWSDNMSFSREAINESQKKNTRQLPASPESSAQTGNLPAAPVNKSATKATPKSAALAGGSAPLPPADSLPKALPSTSRQIKDGVPQGPSRPVKHSTNHLDHYVSEMNQEIDRVSNVVGNRIDNFGDRISNGFQRMFEPIVETVMGLADALAHFFHKITVGLVKAIIQEFTFVLRTLSDKLLGGNRRAPVRTVQTHIPLGTAPFVEAEPDDSQLPSFRSGFGKLVEQKIFFSTIHNRPFLTEKDVRELLPGNKRQEYEWMTRAIEEIRNCAPYGQKLPAPPRGPFMGIPMHDVLREITYSDLESFLVFVSNRPQPFQQKPLKLSEAYATWAHKGAPEQ